MPDDTSSEINTPAPVVAQVDDDVIIARISRAMLWVAGLALVANCLLTSPSQFSEKHDQDRSLLHPVVALLGLWGKFPTTRGVEIRNLIFYVAAAALAVLAGLRMLLARRGPRLTFDDLLDLRARAATPSFWWFLLLLVSFFSSYYAHASSMCMGQLTIRLLETAWWLPLATLLLPRDARRLSFALLTALGLCAAVGLWYYAVRVMPDSSARLRYPIGNELWMGACLLPGLFVGLGLIDWSGRDSTLSSPPRIGVGRILCGVSIVLLVICIAWAMFLTRSRSAVVGLAAGTLTLVCFLSGRLLRRVMLLGTLIAALGASVWLHQALSDSAGGPRSHSIRSRLYYEWPYALHLFFQKPVAGHGDGAYSMLAGKLARDDQLDDPSLLRFDEWSWVAHAHNEFLELLADLGLVGVLAYTVAIVLTIRRAIRFCDDCSSRGRGDRSLIVCLSAALVAMVIEQCGDPAIREPGLPPIFFAVWAALWALVRDREPLITPVAAATDGISVSHFRLAGAVAGLFACALGLQGVGDWRAARARQDAASAMEAHDYATAMTKADFAGESLLDPFQRALARMIAAWARSLAFDAMLGRSAAPPTEAEVLLSEEALENLAALDRDVPRFLRVARLAADLYLNRARAFERLGNKSAESESQLKFLNALVQNQKDDPFLVDRVQALWKAVPRASSMDRLTWLRCLIRGGEIEGPIVELLRTMPATADFVPTMNDLYTLALRDVQRPPQEWQDRLSPETLRIAALAQSLSGRPEEAAKLAAQAQAMYAKTGPRLFAAHAAALHEEVRYRLAADPFSATDDNLQRLAQAETIRGGTADATTPLRFDLGRTRLLVLVAAARKQDSAVQAQRVAGSADAARTLSGASLEVATLCAASVAYRPQAIRFAQQALQDDPTYSVAHLFLCEQFFNQGDDASAFDSAQRFLDESPDRSDAIQRLRSLRERFAASPMWTRLNERLPELSTQPAGKSP